MRDRRDFHRAFGKIDAIGGKPVHHWSEGAADLGLGHMLETQKGAAGWTAAASLDLPSDSVGREIARQHVAAITAVVPRRIVLLEFTHLGIEQSAAQLVAKRIPHDRVHADKPWRKVPNGKELHELPVAAFAPPPQRPPLAVTPPVGTPPLPPTN